MFVELSVHSDARAQRSTARAVRSHCCTFVAQERWHARYALFHVSSTHHSTKYKNTRGSDLACVKSTNLNANYSYLKENQMQTVAIDFMNIFHRGLHAHSELMHKTKHTGCLYGMLTGVASAIRETDARRIFVCTDTRPYFREKINKEYKASRRKKDYNESDARKFTDSMQMCLELFDVLEIPVISVKGLEADDLIAIASKRFKNVNAVSNDTDLYQLLGVNNFRMYRGRAKGFYTRQDLVNEHGVTPRQWLTVTALSGSHNGMPGIPKIGIKTAVRIITDREFQQKMQPRLNEYTMIVERNMHAAKLPFPGMGYQTLEFPNGKARYDYRKLLRFCTRHGINLTDDTRYAFERVTERNKNV